MTRLNELITTVDPNGNRTTTIYDVAGLDVSQRSTR